MNSTFYISTEKSLLERDLIFNFLINDSYWAKERNRETIEKSIENSMCFGVFDSANKQSWFC